MAYSVTPAPLIGYVSLSYVSVELYRFTDFETSEHLSVVRITNGKFLMPGTQGWQIGLTWILLLL